LGPFSSRLSPLMSSFGAFSCRGRTPYGGIPTKQPRLQPLADLFHMVGDFPRG
jgi:hypothetical protein